MKTNLHSRATVTTPPRSAPAVDPFAPAVAQFEQTLAWARDLSVDLSAEQLERKLLVDAREVARCVLQGRLDARAAREREAPTAPKGFTLVPRFRASARALQTVFGDVTVRRLCWRDRNHFIVRPADAELNLPPERYSLMVRRFVAEGAATRSFDTALAELGRQGIDVPKRQAQQLVARMAQDFESFYAWQQAPVNDTPAAPSDLLVMSCDSKGVRMLLRALREATRKAAQEERGRPRGDPMARRRERTHDRRMAVVTAIWDQPPKPRDPDVIVDNLRPAGQRSFAPELSEMPRPRNKRVNATLTNDMPRAIADLFDEAERRDPAHARTWVMLLDGADEQRRLVEREAERRGVRVTIVMDLLHVLHYLWQAAMALHGDEEGEAEGCVRRYVGKVLRRPMADVAAGLRQSATLRKLTGKAREVVDRCADYLADRAPWLAYEAALAAGLPIATGVIEGACRHLVQDRMGITGACWDLPMAEAVLRLRALVSSGHWEAYVAFHLRCEHERNRHLARGLEVAA